MRAFSIIAIRLLAVYLVTRPLMALASSLPAAFATAEAFEDWRLLFSASLVLPCLLGVLLWFKAPALAQRLHPNESASDSVVGEAGLVRAGSFLIGVYLVVQHLSSLLSRWQWGGGLDIGSLAALLIGLALIPGASAMGKLFHRLREF
ncbi:hypothetical protein [Halomonas sp. GD1P12]|uniref:hypothetical protein n=1 Tax=Halomonas sp. GD1P12 TaxID=2982691 RepID=UPI0021E424C1|nr:hypothetical protein [Halomonas sp. GD1P12]UYG01186.1 hypothetical protein OCT39_06450 [Halomonas sp. GD1P12]